MWVGGGDNNSGIKRRLALQGFNGFLVPGAGLEPAQATRFPDFLQLPIIDINYLYALLKKLNQ
jgi:hypothetical protein